MGEDDEDDQADGDSDFKQLIFMEVVTKQDHPGDPIPFYTSQDSAAQF